MPLELLIVFGVAWGTCFLLIPLVRILAFRIRLLDCPDGRRKIQGEPIPAAGGIAIFFAGMAAIALAFVVPGSLCQQLLALDSGLLAIFAAALLICIVGVADDYGCLRGRQKLAGQCLAAIIVMGSGLVVRSVQIFGWTIDLGILAVPFTGLWLVATMNSLNLLDGMDGLLGSIGLILCLALAAIAVLSGQGAAACVACALAGALLGFLQFNFPPATIYLGDCGSMLIGLMVGVLTLRSGQTSTDTVAFLGPAALLVVPFLDTIAAIVRRKLTGRSIYVTDRGHLHHCLLRHGLSRRSVILLVAILCVVAVVGVLAGLLWKNDWFAVLGAAVVIGILVGGQLFGHMEWQLLRKRMLVLLHSLIPRGSGVAKRVEVRLQGSAGWQDVWNELIACAHRLDLVEVRFNVNAPALHECYHAHWSCAAAAPEDGNLWRADIPLAVAGQTVARLEVSGRRGAQPTSVQFADVAKLTEQFELAVSEVAEVAASATAGVRPVAPRTVSEPALEWSGPDPHFSAGAALLGGRDKELTLARRMEGAAAAPGIALDRRQGRDRRRVNKLEHIKSTIPNFRDRRKGDRRSEPALIQRWEAAEGQK